MPTATLTGLDQPTDLGFDASGNLFVANLVTDTVSEFAPGSTTPTRTLYGLSAPMRMTFDDQGDLYVTNYNDSTVSEFTPGLLPEDVVPVVASYVGNTPGNPDPYVAGNLLTSSNSISYTLTFNGPVTGVDPSQFALATTGTVSAGSVHVQPINSTTYTVTVSGITGAGTLGLNLMNSGGILDLAGNALPQGSADAIGQVYTIDTNPPIVQSFVAATPANPDPNNPGALLTDATSVSYDLTFSEPVTGLNAADFGMQPGFGSPAIQVTPVAGSDGTAYTVTVNGITGSGGFNVYLNTLSGITDQSGFAFNLTAGPAVTNFPWGQTNYTIDQVPPVVLAITPHDVGQPRQPYHQRQ